MFPALELCRKGRLAPATWPDESPPPTERHIQKWRREAGGGPGRDDDCQIDVEFPSVSAGRGGAVVTAEDDDRRPDVAQRQHLHALPSGHGGRLSGQSSTQHTPAASLT